MGNNILFKKIWEDEALVEVEITCVSPRITASCNLYITPGQIEELSDTITGFCKDNLKNSVCWKYGVKECEDTNYFSICLKPRDLLGHIRAEVYMKIPEWNDSGMYCCIIPVETELGAIELWAGELRQIKKAAVGTVFSL